MHKQSAIALESSELRGGTYKGSKERLETERLYEPLAVGRSLSPAQRVVQHLSKVRIGISQVPRKTK